MRASPFLIASLMALTGCAASEATAPRSPNVLPLRALRLYETGVGYFERSGDLGGPATALPVPAGHLDDALKSLVVLNGGAGGKVSGLSFASSVSKGVARARAGLPVDTDQPITYRDLLVSLKGEQVEVSTASSPVLGRVIEVTEENDEVVIEPVKEGGKSDAGTRERTPQKVLVLTLLSERGEIVKLRGPEVRRVRPVDPAFAARLDRALDAVSTRSAQKSRPLSLLGDARGAITFGYIAETPLWRTTYRLVLGAEGKGGTLQGWALVHNDTDEAWRGVSLSLVNGQPDSFVFPLAAPRYVRRSLVHPDEPLSTIPQLQDQTADTLWGDNADVTAAAGGASVTGFGYGSGHGRLASSHVARAPAIRMGSTSSGELGRSSLLSVGNLAEVASASGAEQGALFTYTAPAAFSLDARSSALVPFLQTKVEVEPLAWFDSVSSSARIAVRFTNSTGQTLPAGTLAVFAAGGFTGEGGLDRLKPGERRFIQFGNDLDAEVSEKKQTTTEVLKRLTFSRGRLEQHFLRTTHFTYEVENRATAPRAFYVGIRADRNASVKGADALDYDEASARPMVVFRQPAKQKGDRVFDVTEGLSRSWNPEDLGEKHLKDLSAQSTLPPAEAAVAADAATKARDAEAAQKALQGAAKEITAIEADIARFREHLKALGGDKGGAGAGNAAAPLVKRLLDAEDHLAAAIKRREGLEKDRAARLDALRATLAKLPSSG